MTRRLAVWTSLVVLAAGVVLHTSLRTRGQEDKLAALTRDISSEQERIRVLTAEWHRLKTPERLEALSKRHLRDLTSVETTQLVSLTDIPEPLPVPSVALAAAVIQPDAVKPATEQPIKLAQASKPAVPKPARPVVKATVKSPPEPIDEVAALIAQSGGSRPSAEVLTVVERTPTSGVLWASMQEMQ